MSNHILKGYSLDELDQTARDIIQTLSELEVPIDLAILGLCRCISVIGNEDDLDNACRLLDDLHDIPYDNGMRVAIESMETE